MRRNRERERERVREKIGGRKVWVGDRGREDIKGERGEQKKENTYIYGEKISASSSSREEGRRLFMDCMLAHCCKRGGGGRDKFRMLFNNAY